MQPAQGPVSVVGCARAAAHVFVCAVVQYQCAHRDAPCMGRTSLFVSVSHTGIGTETRAAVAGVGGLIDRHTLPCYAGGGWMEQRAFLAVRRQIAAVRGACLPLAGQCAGLGSSVGDGLFVWYRGKNYSCLLAAAWVGVQHTSLPAQQCSRPVSAECFSGHISCNTPVFTAVLGDTCGEVCLAAAGSSRARLPGDLQHNPSLTEHSLACARMVGRSWARLQKHSVWRRSPPKKGGCDTVLDVLRTECA